ncbi:MAG: DnaD domain protein [Erysipelotrichaceae bacterium]|nr:DnaD domain protein [Erysipelotrichaceae bacterium]
MDIYREKYFNRRNWILENLSALNLTAAESLIVLLIDFCNEFSQPIDIQVLSRLSNLNKEDVDDAIVKLCSKGYLTIEQSGSVISFNIDAVFTHHNISYAGAELYKIFEAEFGRILSERELERLSEWTRLYSHEQIVDALREASINRKLNFSFIDRQLASKDEDGQK